MCQDLEEAPTVLGADRRGTHAGATAAHEVLQVVAVGAEPPAGRRGQEQRGAGLVHQVGTSCLEE